MSAVIEARGLTKKYGRRTAVDHLDLSIESGEIFGFLGPNGAGKTTTILMLIGLSEPTSGEARVLGSSPLKEPLKVRRTVGYLPENMGFYNELTARQNLTFVAELNGMYGKGAERRVTESLAAVGLEERMDHKVAAFSRGMRQRLGLAELLVKDPQILFLDEPTLGLDPEGINKMLELILALSRERGLTVVLSSHLLHLVGRIADRVALLREGRLLAVGSVEQLALEFDPSADLEAVYAHYFNETVKKAALEAGI